ncbi:hypothetical protein JCM3765_005818 [Sporobolomyces pararoseus]
MPVRALPHDALQRIFQNLSTLSSDLYHSLLVCRAFSKIIKPILYRHILISTSKRRDLLQNIRKEDQQLVKHVTIRGCGPLELEDIEPFYEEFLELGADVGPEFGPGEDCVAELLGGQLLDITVIETLHVRNVVENPRAPNPWEDGSVEFKTASKLSELSVWGHQGGAELWLAYLRQEYLPGLRRLGFSDVTLFNQERIDRERYLSDDSDDSWAGLGCPQVEQREEQLFLNDRMPLAQLEVVVSPIASDFNKLPNFPYNNSLAIISDFGHPSKDHFSYRKNFALLYSKSSRPEELQRLFDIVYRAAPPSNAKGRNVHLFLDDRPGRISPSEYDRMVSKVKGYEVHVSPKEKESDSDSLILPSFVQHLRETCKLHD